jgi:protein SCO1
MDAGVETGSEIEIAARIEALAADPDQCAALLREDHAIYAQRGAAAVVRLRGWILLTLARHRIDDRTLVHVLEELDAGLDPYLVAAAARALRRYPHRSPELAPFVMRAIENMTSRDEPISFERYGEYATTTSACTSPLQELFETLAWLGPAARAIHPELEALRRQSHVLSRARRRDLDRVIARLRADASPDPSSCCTWPFGIRDRWSPARAPLAAVSIGETRLEDHDGRHLTFDDLVRGHVTIVVFFYTRCDNPLKCSLSLTKLGRLQRLIEERALAGQIHTAAITYDPAFDLPDRLRRYAQVRGMRLGPDHRVLRAPDGIDALRRHFGLGVNFIESLVNRHRIEVYLLDRDGATVGAFEHLRWDEVAVLERAVDLLHQPSHGHHLEIAAPQMPATVASSPSPASQRSFTSPTITLLASLAWAFFPKCPMCWAAYVSAFGIAGLDRLPYLPWVQPVLSIAMLIMLATTWLRARETGRVEGATLVTAGLLVIALTRMGTVDAAVWGAVLTMIGSVMGVFTARIAPGRAVPA